MRSELTGAVLVLGSVVVHAVSARLYSVYCAPMGVKLFFIPFFEQTPHCVALRFALNECPRLTTWLVSLAGTAGTLQLTRLWSSVSGRRGV